MSEYYLKYYEVNRGKNQLIRSGNKMSHLSSDYMSVKNGLSGQRGLGIEAVKEKLVLLSRKTQLVSDDLKDIGHFLEFLIHETESADMEASKILNRFSLDSERQFVKFLVKLLKDFNKLLIKSIGELAKQTGHIGVAWTSNILDLINDEAGATDLAGAGKALLSWITKNLVKKIGGDAGNGSAVKAGFNKLSFFASWIAATVVDTIENFTDHEGTFGEDVRESIVESLLEAGKAAAVVAIVAALGLTGGAAAVAAVGIGIVVTWGLNIISEHVFDNDLGMIENLGDVICNWFSQLAF